MKKITRYKLLLVIIILTACNPDDVPTQSAQDLAFERLSGVWTLGTIGSISVDGQDISLNYPGFSLSFADGTYSTTNAGELFSASGNWQWSDPQAGEIELGSGRKITIISLNETLFHFTFNFSGTGGSANGIAGSYEIKVVK